ncbi:DUF6276 family protein [Halorubrum vacuolatum]|uniref:Small CPxCG-related zinc finger protein n=1 Tax=Halorubrum vacuolatum TaxID=63740 RepID=A0A238VNP4_HALVU|nr:DUF6276 family protein [Halorubrum vacuolatum]SNR35980.1 hypothetical protein SAMN06264855_103203 [Halorubrum vacuolatum]
MACPRCGADVVAFAVPEDIREHAPATVAAICTRCLTTHPAAEVGVDPKAVVSESGPDLTAVDSAFPTGDAGIALALMCGLLESYALNRAGIEELLGYAERHGADVFTFLERLDAREAMFDLDRRRQVLLESL